MLKSAIARCIPAFGDALPGLIVCLLLGLGMRIKQTQA